MYTTLVQQMLALSFPKKPPLLSLRSVGGCVWSCAGERCLLTLSRNCPQRWYVSSACPDWGWEYPGLRPQRGLLSFPWTNLSSFACQQKGQALGWAAAQPEVRKVLNTPDQTSRANPLPWSVPARGSWGWLSVNHPLQAPSCGSSALSQWRTGPPARPCSPPLHHTRPLSSTDANGLECFLRHKASHCPWEVLLLSAGPSYTPVTSQTQCCPLCLSPTAFGECSNRDRPRAWNEGIVLAELPGILEKAKASKKVPVLSELHWLPPLISLPLQSLSLFFQPSVTI